MIDADDLRRAAEALEFRADQMDGHGQEIADADRAAAVRLLDRLRRASD